MPVEYVTGVVKVPLSNPNNIPTLLPHSSTKIISKIENSHSLSTKKNFSSITLTVLFLYMPFVGIEKKIFHFTGKKRKKIDAHRSYKKKKNRNRIFFSSFFKNLSFTHKTLSTYQINQNIFSRQK